MTEPVIDPKLVRAACRDGDLKAIVDLSSAIRGRVIRRQMRLMRARREGKGAEYNSQLRPDELNDSTVRNLTYRMLKACGDQGHVPPSELLNVLQYALSYDRPPAKSERRYVARNEAVEYLKHNPGASNREIARHVNVHPGTVGRWRKAGKLQPNSVRNI
jgi:hypothetical protein